MACPSILQVPVLGCLLWLLARLDSRESIPYSARFDGGDLLVGTVAFLDWLVNGMLDGMVGGMGDGMVGLDAVHDLMGIIGWIDGVGLLN